MLEVEPTGQRTESGGKWRDTSFHRHLGDALLLLVLEFRWPIHIIISGGLCTTYSYQQIVI